jgi:hypothetical protein
MKENQVIKLELNQLILQNLTKPQAVGALGADTAQQTRPYETSGTDSIPVVCPTLPCSDALR